MCRRVHLLEKKHLKFYLHLEMITYHNARIVTGCVDTCQSAHNNFCATVNVYLGADCLHIIQIA